MPVPERHRATVRIAALSAGAVGVPGAFSFGVDVTAMTGIWSAMAHVIAEDSGHEIDATYAAKLATGLAAGTAAYVGGSRLAVTPSMPFPAQGRSAPSASTRS